MTIPKSFVVLDFTHAESPPLSRSLPTRSDSTLSASGLNRTGFVFLLSVVNAANFGPLVLLHSFSCLRFVASALDLAQLEFLILSRSSA